MISETPPVRVLLTDDHAVVRIGLKTILAEDPRLQIVGEAANGEECLRLVPALKPQVVLLDLRLPDIPGYEVCRRLKLLPEPPAVLVLTSFADDQLVLESISAGADGYLLKDFEQAELAGAITRVAAGGSILDPVIARKVIGVARNEERGRASNSTFRVGAAGANGNGHGSMHANGNGIGRGRTDRLSPQEQRILNLLADGNTNKEIALAMGLGEGTVRNYLTSVFTKLGVENRTEAVSLWLRRS